jgi:hypothetical protein
LTAAIRAFVSDALNELSGLDGPALIQQRYTKFRSMGRFALLADDDKQQVRLTGFRHVYISTMVVVAVSHTVLRPYDAPWAALPSTPTTTSSR